MSENKNKVSNESLINALCYVPFWALVMIFTQSKKSKKLKNNIRYWNIIFGIYIIINFISNNVFWWFLSWFLFILYAWIIVFFWLKAYNWEKVEIEYIDDLEWKIKDKM